MAGDFRRIDTSNYELNQLQDNIVEAIRTLIRAPFANGILIEDVSVSTTVNNLRHGLDRAYSGFLVLKRTADARVYIDLTSTADTATTIPLIANAADTVDVWVF